MDVLLTDSILENKLNYLLTGTVVQFSKPRAFVEETENAPTQPRVWTFTPKISLSVRLPLHQSSPSVNEALVGGEGWRNRDRSLSMERWQ